MIAIVCVNDHKKQSISCLYSVSKTLFSLIISANRTYLKLLMKTAILNINFPYDSLCDSSDILFNSYYDSSYSGSDLLSNVYYNLLYDSSNLLISDLYDDSSNLFFESHKVYNETQIGNLEKCDGNVNHQEELQVEK
ncbi:hypothetical protein RhiirB3_425171 [Rhizophagus irregularis]|nr:hypothetical protein RhiirB3_425171 [Rhizophagus irregularis]